VCVDGVVRAGATRCLEAKAIYAGSPSEYLESLREGALALKVVGAVFAALGTLTLAITLIWSKLSSARRPL
jgi:hypothetical protein